MDKTLDFPSDGSRDEAERRLAYDSIISVLKAHDALDTGGCRAFYSPQEWKDRDEEYGRNSVLIVVHDGGDHAPFFNYSYECYSLMEAMNAGLGQAGFYAEQCTAWYTAIYKK